MIGLHDKCNELHDFLSIDAGRDRRGSDSNQMSSALGCRRRPSQHLILRRIAGAGRQLAQLQRLRQDYVVSNEDTKLKGVSCNKYQLARCVQSRCEFKPSYRRDAATLRRCGRGNRECWRGAGRRKCERQCCKIENGGQHHRDNSLLHGLGRKRALRAAAKIVAFLMVAPVQSSLCCGRPRQEFMRALD